MLWWKNRSEWLKEITSTPENTPDLYRLDRSQHHLLLEYGEMMIGLPHHRQINELPVIMNAFTVQKMPLWKTNEGQGTIPIAYDFVPKGFILEKPRVCGQLFKLTRDHIIHLDKQRQNGVIFNRKRVRVFVPNPSDNESPFQVSAWMYAGNGKHWQPRIEWDHEFFHHRGGHGFDVVQPQRVMHRWLGCYARFSSLDNMEAPNGNRKSFLYFTKGLNESASSQ